MGVVSAGSLAQTRIFLDRDLQETFAELVSMTGDTITIRRQGLLEQTPRGQWLAMLTPGQAWESIGDRRILISGSGASFGLNHRIELVDAQRLFGRLAEEKSPEPDTVLWTIPGFDDLTISLEQIASIRLVRSSRGPTPFDPSAGDSVVAINSDRFTGFVESMGDPLEIDPGSGVINLPWSLIREVRLSNPKVRSIDPLAWLSDGSIVAFRAGVIDSPSLFTATLALGDQSPPGQSPRGPMISLPAIAIRAISFDPTRLVALSEIQPANIDVFDERRWAPPIDVGDPSVAQLGAAKITISGPVQCEWPLPEGAVRLAGVAVLPEDSRLWGDYELVMGVRTSGGEIREVLRERLNAQQVMVPFNISLRPAGTPISTIVIRLESGEFGPIQDEVVLERTLILLEP